MKKSKIESPVDPRMKAIEKSCQSHAELRATLKSIVTNLEDSLAAITKQQLPALRRTADQVAHSKAGLILQIEEAKDLFESPRSQQFHGLGVGLRKAVGGLEWEDDEEVVDAIERLYKGQQTILDLLIKTTKRPNKDALKECDGKVLAKLGVELTETGDVAFVKPVDSSVDKLVKSYLKTAETQITAKAA